MLENRLELIGGSRKIKKAIAAGAVVFIDFIETFSQRVVTGFVFELALMVSDRLRKVFPDFIPHGLSRKIARGFFEIAPEFVVSFWSAGEADNLDGWWEVAIGGEVIQCGNKLAMGEIARCRSEEHTSELQSPIDISYAV